MILERFTKKLGRLLEFKQSLFVENDMYLARARERAVLYISQPLRTECKNCEQPLQLDGSYFTKFGIRYLSCAVCDHLNGAHQDTEDFGKVIYSEAYQAAYSDANIDTYRRRLREIYVPKAEFLKEAIIDEGSTFGSSPRPSQSVPALCDLGAGAGYFVRAARECGFDAHGFEPIPVLVELANRMNGDTLIKPMERDDLDQVIAATTAPIVSFIGVLEHLQSPRQALEAAKNNPHIKYIFIGVPLFSPTVALESVFENIMPRQLVEDHTHLYTDRSLRYLEKEFGFRRKAAWWFGLDAADLFRNVVLELERTGDKELLASYWKTEMYPLIDEIQGVFDRSRRSSEVHLVWEKP